ncbi:5824_t:CDS:2 [Gigaspora margarita]|uniref:5824_t:CDS:1 n=1 Tax=Gigaspora margarita TaxID=4874 RepID=A0ABM8VXW1_GIGMA|nr:5824_t:CDS:2 [Gigaspora margarita]
MSCSTLQKNDLQSLIIYYTLLDRYQLQHQLKEVSITAPKQNNDPQGQLTYYKAVEKEPNIRFMAYTNLHTDNNW